MDLISGFSLFSLVVVVLLLGSLLYLKDAPTSF